MILEAPAELFFLIDNLSRRDWLVICFPSSNKRQAFASNSREDWRVAVHAAELAEENLLLGC